MGNPAVVGNDEPLAAYLSAKINMNLKNKTKFRLPVYLKQHLAVVGIDTLLCY